VFTTLFKPLMAESSMEFMDALAQIRSLESNRTHLGDVDEFMSIVMMVSNPS
jgi:hypothetical protein